MNRQEQENIISWLNFSKKIWSSLFHTISYVSIEIQNLISLLEYAAFKINVNKAYEGLCLI